MSRRVRKLKCRVCGASMRHDEAWHVIERAATGVCPACRERAEAARDTGWTTFITGHGARYHRERGDGLQLDVEQVANGGGWIGAATRGRVLVAIRCGLPTAREAAEAVEVAMQVEPRPLPVEVSHGF